VEESPEDKATLHPFYDDDTFSVSGVGSGNERQLAWYFDGDEGLPEDLFTLMEDDDTYPGDFSFGQVGY